MPKSKKRPRKGNAPKKSKPTNSGAPNYQGMTMTATLVGVGKLPDAVVVAALEQLKTALSEVERRIPMELSDRPIEAIAKGRMVAMLIWAVYELCYIAYFGKVTEEQSGLRALQNVVEMVYGEVFSDEDEMGRRVLSIYAQASFGLEENLVAAEVKQAIARWVGDHLELERAALV
jgi:hypothetical protein